MERKYPITNCEGFIDEISKIIANSTAKNIVEEIFKEITDELFEGYAEEITKEIFEGEPTESSKKLPTSLLLVFRKAEPEEFSKEFSRIFHCFCIWRIFHCSTYGFLQSIVVLTMNDEFNSEN